MRKRKTIEDQAKPLRDLIDYARQRDALGKAKATRAQLIDALMTLGRTRKEAEREVENARRRVRNAANKAEQLLEGLLHDVTTWDWTDPTRAIRLMRSREFGGFEDAPLTDIEQGLVEKGNVLLIIAVYSALKWAIFSRLSGTTGAARNEVPLGALEVPSKPSVGAETGRTDTSPK